MLSEAVCDTLITFYPCSVSIVFLIDMEIVVDWFYVT